MLEQSKVYCGKCMKPMITTREEARGTQDDKPATFVYYMHHCPKCMILDFTSFHHVMNVPVTFLLEGEPIFNGTVKTYVEI